MYSDLTVICCECKAYGSLLLFEVGGWLPAWQGQKAITYIEELLYNVRDERERRERERERKKERGRGKTLKFSFTAIPALVELI